MEILDQLDQLGLGGKKAAVYLALLKMGSGTVIQIAREAGIKRPTVYVILEELYQRNIVSYSYVGKKRIYKAEDPASLKQMPQQQLLRIDSLLPSLQALYNLAPRKPRIEYYEGVEGMKRVDSDLLTVQSREYFYFGSVKGMVAAYGADGAKHLENYVKQRVARKIWSNSIRIREEETPLAFMKAGAERYRRVRYFPISPAEDVVALFIYDNKVAVQSALKESYGLIIESRELAVLLMAVWRLVWSIATPA